MYHRIGSAFWFVIGAYAAISAYKLGLGKLNQPGPGFIFFLCSLFLIVLSLVDAGKTFGGKVGMPKGTGDQLVWQRVRWQKVLLLIGGITIYICVFTFLGFILSTFLLMVFLFKAVEPTKWWISIASSLITIVISIGLFRVWLKVYFPVGIFGF